MRGLTDTRKSSLNKNIEDILSVIILERNRFILRNACCVQYKIDMFNCINKEETSFNTFESKDFCFINPEHNMLMSRNSPLNQIA